MPLLRTRYVPFSTIAAKRVKADLIQNARRGPNCAVPNKVYAKDGRCFFPCTFCCRAFASEKHQSSHMPSCHFRNSSKDNQTSIDREKEQTSLTNTMRLDKLQANLVNGNGSEQQQEKLYVSSELFVNRGRLVDSTIHYF